jgi:hypothetical protein
MFAGLPEKPYPKVFQTRVKIPSFKQKDDEDPDKNVKKSKKEASIDWVKPGQRETRTNDRAMMTQPDRPGTRWLRRNFRWPP